MSVYLNRIKEFNKITVTQICRDLKIDRVNLVSGRCKESKEKAVYEELEKRLKEIGF